jgi:hypothetical protein
LRGTRETNRQAQETQQQTNATRQTHQNPKKKPQTTDSLLLYFPRTPTTLHTDTKADNTTERHSSLQQWLQQDDMVASLEDEGGKKPVEREKDTHHVDVRSIFLCSDVCTCTSCFDTTTTTTERERACALR